MTAPDALPGYEALMPEGHDFVNEVAARVVPTITAYRPGRAAKKVAMPILFCVCDHDSVTPPAETLAYARTAPKGEIKTYDAGHFDIYLGEPFESCRRRPGRVPDPSPEGLDDHVVLIPSRSPRRPGSAGPGRVRLRRTFSNAELLDRVQAAASAPHELGIGPRDVVALKLTNRVEFIVLLFAAWRSAPPSRRSTRA